jgi:tRNA A-37 threonylcarbamoyl transferase component Bud32
MTSSNNASSISIGSYQLFERVGEGSSAQVYRATGADGKPVAVKLLSPTAQLDDSSAHARFEREIAILSELDHPNLVKLLDHGVDEELGPYVVTPLVPGKTLRDLIGETAICPEAALLILAPLVEAIAALHAVDLVHRDIKPENAIATPDGNVVVVDLGLAYRPGQTRHTDDGDVVGSIPYMAPEQIEAGAIAASVDIWPIGVMAYEWLAGKRPFARARPAEEAAAILVGGFTPVTAADRRVGGDVAEMIAACLSRNPEQRPSAMQLLERVRQCIDWADDDGHSSELAAVIGDPAGYQDRVTATRVRRLQREARAALDAGKPFEALKHVDRGLAYDADDAVLIEIASAAENASARQVLPPATVAAPGPKSNWLPLAAAGVAVVVGAIMIAVTVLGGSGKDDERTKRRSSSRIPTPGDVLTEMRNRNPGDEDTELASDLFDVVQRGFTMGKRDEQSAELSSTAAQPLLINPIPFDAMSDDDDARSLQDFDVPVDVPVIGLGPDANPELVLVEANRRVAENPNDPDVLLTRAVALIAFGDFTEGIAALDALLAAHPSHGSAWETRAFIHVQVGELEASIAAYDRAIEHGADRAAALRNRGIVQYALGHTRSAYADLTSAVIANPADIEALAELLRIYEHVGHVDASLPIARRLCLATVAKHDPRATEACKVACERGSKNSCIDR